VHVARAKSASFQIAKLMATKANAFPSVAWVIPTYADSDHSGNGSDSGPGWVHNVINSIMRNHPLWESTAIVVVWDDSGGWYDHIAPPQQDFRGLAMRVPCIIISRYAKRGVVSHTAYETGSILKFIEQALGLNPIGPTADGYTDTRATSIIDSFDFTQADYAFPDQPASYPPSQYVNEPPSTTPPDSGSD
jgi:phospholipase C